MTEHVVDTLQQGVDVALHLLVVGDLTSGWLSVVYLSQLLDIIYYLNSLMKSSFTNFTSSWTDLHKRSIQEVNQLLLETRNSAYKQLHLKQCIETVYAFYACVGNKLVELIVC